MSDGPTSLARLLERDKRYRIEAYLFVFDALDYAHRVLGLGADVPSEGENEGEARPAESPEGGDERTESRHLTGQELSEAMRLFALDQFGYLAKCVLNSWGVYTTGDFGELVYNLIEIGQMRKTAQDRREDFDDVFDFENGLRKSFAIELPK